MLPDNDLVKERLRKLGEIREAGVDPYPYSYPVSIRSKEINELFKDLQEPDSEEFHVAGRLVAMRSMGKVAFAHILDNDGKVQLYFGQDDLGKDKIKFLKKIDLGDFIGAKGNIFRTKKGDLTLHVKEYQLLTKAVRPLPDKHHGVKDPEIRYRKRYLDLISNPEVKSVFIQRSKILSSIRRTMEGKQFLEVETPQLQPIYGGALARPFKSKLNALNMDVYMRIAPELYLKRLLVGGHERVYDLGKSFRNEGVDKTHNPEFTIMEAYWAYVDYNTMMSLVEELYANAIQEIHGTLKIPYGDHELNFETPWPRMSMKEALIKHAEIDVDKLSVEEMMNLCRTFTPELEGEQTKGVMTELLFEELVEDKLIGPIFITDYPIESTPLCKPKRGGDPGIIERFEGFVAGFEICNGYSELNDPILQRKLFEEQAESLRALKGEAQPMDEDFLEAIEQGMPPAGGVGLGLDRMIMIITNQQSIRDVIFFPFMKIDQEKPELMGKEVDINDNLS